MKILFIALLLTACGSSPVNQSGPPTFTGLPLAAEQKAEVTRQILETNAIAPQYGIANPKPPSAYIVEVKPAEREKCETPGSLVEYTTDMFYDQTVSDKDPQPGVVLLCYMGRFHPPNKIIITTEGLPHQIVRFESEHGAVYPGALYDATVHHPPDKPHPFLRPK